MKKFFDFLKLQEGLLLEDSRLQNLDAKNYKELAEYCKKNGYSESLKKMIETGVLLFRGQRMGNNNKKFFLMDPIGIERNTRTHLPFTYVYNSMINTKGDWSEYPNRNKSIIFTNNWKYARAYGNGDTFLIIPQKCKMGVCPQGDMFICFNKIGIESAHETENFLMPEEELPQLNNKTDWESVKKILYKHFLKKMKKSYYEMSEDYFIENFLNQLENKDYKGFSKILDELFSPKTLGFSVINFPDEIDKLKGDRERELWTDSKCIVFRFSKIEECNDLLNKIYPLL